MPISKTCQKCSKEFSVPVRRSEKVRFCSRACYDAATVVEKVRCVCLFCKKEFFEQPSQVKYGKVKYCSKLCRDQARTDPLKPGSKYRLPKKRKVIKTCKQCGTEFRVPQCREHIAEYCSKTCMYLSPERLKKMSEASSGAKSKRWKGGRYTSKSRGYISVNVPGHPGGGRHGNHVGEHRLVIEAWMRELAPDHPFLYDHNGVKYLRGEIEVHHRNEVRDDNRRDNLLAVTKDAHHRIHNRQAQPQPWECWPAPVGP